MRHVLIGMMLSALSALSSIPAALPAAAQTPRADAIDASVRILKQATTVQRDNLHNELLRSLRSMRDPSLVPFFTRLTDQSDIFVRINGILGLAEIGESGMIDPFHIRRLSSELERVQAIDQAILFEMIDPPTARKMLAWDDLEETPRLALIAELIRSDEPLTEDEKALLLSLSDSEKDTIRGVARMLWVQVSGHRELFEAYRSTLGELGARERQQAHIWLFNDIGRFGLDQLIWWIEEVLASDEADHRIILAGLAAAVHADQNRGLEMWKRSAQSDRTHVWLVRMGLLLLAMLSQHDLPADVFDLLRDGETLTERIADVGRAMATGSGAVPAFNALNDLDHWQSSNHLIFAGEKLTPEEESQVLEHLIMRVQTSEYRPDERITSAIRATPRLLEIDPAAVRRIMSSVEDDSRLQEALLMGLLASESPDAGTFVSLAPRRGLGRADAFAILLEAKHSAALDEAVFQDLGIIASGGARVAPAYSVQAAWLYLKHAGRIEYAMSQLFNAEE